VISEDGYGQRAPSRLYKYRSLATAQDLQWVCKTISDHRLFWPSPLLFNDPFDCVPAHVYAGTKAQHERNARMSAQALGRGKSRLQRRMMKRQALRRTASEIIETMEAANFKMMEAVGVCSLSETRDNLLMWAHYADAHAGLCLGFETLLPAIDFASAFQVQYSEDRPVINLIDRTGGRDLIDKLLLTKSSHWAYEKEWRMLDHRIGDRFRPFPPAALKEVILGARISSAAEETVATAIRKSRSDPRIFRAHPNRDKFYLDIAELPEGSLKRRDSPRSAHSPG